MKAGASVLLSVSEPDAIGVLLIEDGVIDREFLADELSKQGYAVATVASLPVAPDAARDADVIVLHCDWANISSIDLLCKLHRLGLNVPIVLLTGEAPSALECLAFDKGAVDVIFKSRGSEVLLRRLKSVVNAFQSRGPTAARQIHDLRQAASASRCQPGLLEGRRSRPHPWRIQHRPPADFKRGPVRDVPCDDRLHYEGFIAGKGSDGYRTNVRSAIKRIRNRFRDFDATFDKIENYAGFGYWKKPA